MVGWPVVPRDVILSHSVIFPYGDYSLSGEKFLLNRHFPLKENASQHASYSF